MIVTEKKMIIVKIEVYKVSGISRTQNCHMNACERELSAQESICFDTETTGIGLPLRYLKQSVSQLGSQAAVSQAGRQTASQSGSQSEMK